MLEVKSVKAGYWKKGKKTWESSEITFHVSPGEILALAGPSGCGKTTILNIIAGIGKPISGQVLWNKIPLNPRNARIGLIPQNYGLLPFQTVWQNGFFCAGKSPENEKGLEKLLKRLGIWEVRNHYPSQLSGGQAQRAALARALLAKPSLLLMDEPFSALDSAISIEAQDMALTLIAESNAAGIIITHRMEEALYLADKIIVMKEFGTVGQEYTNKQKGQRTGISQVGSLDLG